MNSRTSHVDFLDDIRGIAILAVFCFHSLQAAFGFDHLPWSGLFRSFDVSYKRPALSARCPSVIALKAIVSTQQTIIVTNTPFQPQ